MNGAGCRGAAFGVGAGRWASGGVGDTQREASSSEVSELRKENARLKERVADFLLAPAWVQLLHGRRS